jgi:hypothetical protein
MMSLTGKAISRSEEDKEMDRSGSAGKKRNARAIRVSQVNGVNINRKAIMRKAANKIILAKPKRVVLATTAKSI